MPTKPPSIFKIGDRVSRQIEVGKPERRFGTVTEIYRSKQGFVYTPQRLYAVKWDDTGEIGRGYIEEGLQIER